MAGALNSPELERVLSAATLANSASQRILETIREGDEDALADCAWDVATPLMQAALLALEAGGTDDYVDRAAVRAALAGYVGLPGSTVGATSFVREDRYIIIKRRHLSAEQAASLEELMVVRNIHSVPGVTVECDWPEYEAVWAMIERRVLSEGGGRL